MSLNILTEIHPDPTSSIHSGKPFYILTASLPEATPSPPLSAVITPRTHLSHAAPALSLLSELWVMADVH